LRQYFLDTLGTGGALEQFQPKTQILPLPDYRHIYTPEMFGIVYSGETANSVVSQDLPIGHARRSGDGTTEVSMLIDHMVACKRKRYTGLLHIADLNGQLIGQPQIISVQKRDVPSPRRLNPGIPRDGSASVPIHGDHFDPRILNGVLM
jgi:hypothetical protein